VFTTPPAEGAICPFPALVAIHGVVAATDGGDAVCGQLGQVISGRVRRHVAPVGKRVDPGFLGREAEQRLQVIDMRVDAAVRNEPEQMDVTPTLAWASERRDEGSFVRNVPSATDWLTRTRS